MKFDVAEENKGLIDRLEHSVETGTVFHAYLIEGGKQVDKKAFARAFAKGILCPKRLGENCGDCGTCDKIDHDNHEDLVYLARKKANIPVEDVRDAIRRITLQPMNTRNILIIEDGDGLNDVGQNTLLKTLEEPPGQSLIMILTENGDELLPTIRSRCVRCRIEGASPAAAGETAEKAGKLVDMILGGAPYYRLIREAEEAISQRENCMELIEGMEYALRKHLVPQGTGGDAVSARSAKAIEAMEEAADQIRRGMAHRYIFRKMLLTIGG